MSSMIAPLTMHVERTSAPRPKPAEADLGFGRHFADHMFVMRYHAGRGWDEPRIVPYAPFTLDPATSVFHYGQAMFEGLKAFRGPDGTVAIFRVDRHCQRMASGAPRLAMPAPDPEVLQTGILALVATDEGWVPSSRGTALYIRPTFIATQPFLGVHSSEDYTLFVITSPVGRYYSGGMKPLRIWIERERVRAVRGGVGAVKASGNYAASLQVAAEARQLGCDQVLWLDAVERRFLEEVGTMNAFVVIGDEVATPPLGGSILAGVTRDSVLTLARDMGLTVNERPITVEELETAHANGTLREVFGTGTAAVIQSVGTLVDASGERTIGDGTPGPVAERLFDAITRIQYGEAPDPYQWRFAVPTR